MAEIDFFNMEKENYKRLSSSSSSSANNRPIFERKRSFRDIQGVISKISPEVLKSVIGNYASSSVPSSPTKQTPFPVCDPTLRLSCASKKNGGNTTAPMTVFYNGTVAVFDVSPHQANDILKLAQEGLLKPADSSASINISCDKENLLENLNDLPIARKKSLQRFLEKRTGRYMASPVRPPHPTIPQLA